MDENRYYPIAYATVFSVAVLLHLMFMVAITAPVINSLGSITVLMWHIAISLAYFTALIYAYKKRAVLPRKKINFFVMTGFLLYIFLSFSGCFILSSISMH